MPKITLIPRLTTVAVIIVAVTIAMVRLIVVICSLVHLSTLSFWWLFGWGFYSRKALEDNILPLTHTMFPPSKLKEIHSIAQDLEE
ncbi:hypothetical protein L484_016171 [Morus notabilis]|uniref:Uncharacterized protein n=1 Tax=Morus notabilis TaxID=981085 RepID=W9RH63_9ROSA|nr:hypothetical protein L484_016171 [Morus notabilis]